MHKTKQSKAKQIKTKQNKTKQNKTKQIKKTKIKSFIFDVLSYEVHPHVYNKNNNTDITKLLFST